MLDDTNTPRASTAQAVADAVGRRKRVVLTWINRDPPVPHSVVRSKGGKRSEYRFSVAEVREWMAAQGLDGQDSPRGYRLAKPAASSASAATIEDAKDLGGLFAHAAAYARQPKTFEAQIAEQQAIVASLTKALGQPDLKSTEIQRITAAHTQAQTQLRMLREERLKAELHAGEWVTRADAIVALSAVPAAVAAALDRLAADLPGALMDSLHGLVAPESVPAARRAVAEAAARRIDEARERAAGEMERAAVEIERRAGDGGSNS